MKIAAFFVILSFLGANSYAAKPELTCKKDEDLKVELYQSAKGNYRAEVTVQSVGDSYPTFKFKNVSKYPNTTGRLGAPVTYQGNGFTLTVQMDADGRPGYLTVESLSLSKVVLSCE